MNVLLRFGERTRHLLQSSTHKERDNQRREATCAGPAAVDRSIFSAALVSLLPGISSCLLVQSLRKQSSGMRDEGGGEEKEGTNGKTALVLLVEIGF